MTTDKEIELSKEAQELQAMVATARVIGAQTYWENRGGVTRQELRDAAEAQGLAITVPEPNPEGTFKGVVKSVSQVDKNLVARETRNDDVLTWAIARIDAGADTKVGDQAGEIVNRVLWRKVEMPGQPRFAFHQVDDVAKALSDRYDHLMRYLTADEVRTAVGELLRGFGGVRMMGRLWFVGLAGYDRLLQVQSMLKAVGMVCHVIPTLDLGDSMESMAHSARRQVWQDLKELQGEVARWKAGTRNPRRSTLQARMDVFRNLRDGVENMADVLQLQADDLRAELDGMMATAMAMMDPDAAPPPGAPPEPPQDADSAPDAEGQAPEGGAGAEADSGQDSATAAPVPPPAPGKPCPYIAMTMKELKKAAKAAGLRPGKMGKDALVAALSEMP